MEQPSRPRQPRHGCRSASTSSPCNCSTCSSRCSCSPASSGCGSCRDLRDTIPTPSTSCPTLTAWPARSAGRSPAARRGIWRAATGARRWSSPARCFRISFSMCRCTRPTCRCSATIPPSSGSGCGIIGHGRWRSNWSRCSPAGLCGWSGAGRRIGRGRGRFWFLAALVVLAFATPFMPAPASANAFGVQALVMYGVLAALAQMTDTKQPPPIAA